MGERLYIERFLWFDSQVRQGSYPNASTMADAFEFDRKTAQRSIDYFRDTLRAPLEYHSSRKGYYYTDPSFQLPVMRLSESELVALLASHRLLADAAAGPLSDELGKVSAKLGALLTDSLDGIIDPERAFSFRWNTIPPSDPLVFSQVASALLHCRPLSFCYYSPHNSTCTVRTAEPHHMTNYMGAWHVIAFCRLRNDWRDFHLSRITLCSLGPEQFTPRPEGQWRPYLEETFGIFQNRERFEVVLKFSVDRARWVKDHIWHPDQRMEELESGELILTLPVSHEVEILMETLKHGTHVEALQSAWLRQRIRDEIGLMMKKY